MRKLAAFAFFAACAWSQDTTRVYHFANLKTAASFQEVANIFRIVDDISQVTVQASSDSLTVSGNAVQLATADWLFPQLDQSSAKPGPANQTYTTTGDQGTIRVYHLTHTGSRAQLQEIINVLRSTADVPRVSPVSDSTTIALRGTADQAGVADWLVSLLDAAAPTPGTPIQSHQIAAKLDTEIRLAHLSHATDPKSLQEVVNTMRTIGDMNRAFPVNSVGVVVFRGTTEQVALGEWLLGQVDLAAGQQGPAPHQQLFTAPWDKSTSQARVFYFAHAESPQAIQEITNAVRVNAHINRAYPCMGTRLLALRGSPEQIAQAADLISQLDR